MIAKQAEKAVSSAEGVLVRLKNKINFGFNINPQTLKLLVDEFVYRKYGRSNTKAHFDKVNTYNELTSDRMTIKVFFKFLRVIKIKKVTFTLTVVNHRDKEITITEDVFMAIHPTPGETDD